MKKTSGYAITRTNARRHPGDADRRLSLCAKLFIRKREGKGITGRKSWAKLMNK